LKYHCATAKTIAVTRNVISPLIAQEMKDILTSLNFLTIITDASNRKSDKMLPILARGFHPQEGVKTFCLSLHLITDETALTITEKILETAREWDITKKIIGFAADNCVTNFGGLNRGGSNNVFALLKSRLHHGLIGVGCSSKEYDFLL
jgi:hypothetical protein